MSDKDDEEVSQSELAEFDFLLDALKEEGADSINGFDLVRGLNFARHARDDWRAFERQQRAREARASWTPHHRVRSILPDDLAKKDLGDLTLKELLGLEIPIEKLLELRRNLGEGKGKTGP
ncbi:hypothetical protein ACLMAJ_16985 [Nocardia sp. KC 131]|uniref:hypothetical protein n=1 Tax=Nocardia arseniciresistens TaxID=3392119 RepID=UPI00398EAC51